MLANKELDLDEIKKIQLEILVDVNIFCNEHGIKYSLTAGTLLGAVRHSGYIPWDDDIDIVMPRPDYDKFILSYKSKLGNLQLICHENNNKYKYLFAKIYNSNTILIDDFVDNGVTEIGVHIDIFPVDGMGRTHKTARSLITITEIYRNIITASCWKRYEFSKSRSVIYEPIRFIFFILSRVIPVRRLIQYVSEYERKYDFYDSKFVGCICGSYRYKGIMEERAFLKYTKLKFENKFYSCIKDYDSYLKILYGDYMKLPPLEQRVTHHTFKAYYK